MVCFCSLAVSNVNVSAEDNAENLCFIFIALQDKFELSQFEENRQAAVNALVVCCPELAAPFVFIVFCF